MPIPKASRDEASSRLKAERSGFGNIEGLQRVEFVWALGGPGANRSVEKECRKSSTFQMRVFQIFKRDVCS